MIHRLDYQSITTPNGEEMIVMSRAHFDALSCADLDDDAVALRVMAQSKAAQANGEAVSLPDTVWERLEAQENPIRVLRQYRGLTQSRLARIADISQNYLSAIEKGDRDGTVKTVKAIAKALHVPVAILIEDHEPLPDCARPDCARTGQEKATIQETRPGSLPQSPA